MPNIGYFRTLPVYITLCGSDDNEIAEAGVHFDHTVFEIELFFRVVLAVAHRDLLRVVDQKLKVPPLHSSFDDKRRTFNNSISFS